MRSISFTKEQLEKAVLVLRAHEHYEITYALEEAIREHEFDGHHRLFHLELINEPTIVERAASAVCSTDCARFCAGTCSFISDEEKKTKCYRIRAWIEAELNDVDIIGL